MVIGGQPKRSSSEAISWGGTAYPDASRSSLGGPDPADTYMAVRAGLNRVGAPVVSGPNMQQAHMASMAGPTAPNEGVLLQRHSASRIGMSPRSSSAAVAAAEQW